MEGKIEDTTTCLQNENVVPVSQKKKSGIPVLVKKGAQTHRAVLATVSEFQQNVLQNNTEHKPVQTWPTTRSSDRQKGCKDITRKASSLFDKDCKSAVTSSTDLHTRAVQKTPKMSAAVCACPTSESSSQTPRNVPDKLVSLVEEQQQSGIEFQRDSNALKSILTNAGIAMSASGTVSEMFRPQRATEGQGRPVYTPAKHAALMRNSVYTKEPRMSLIDSCNQYKQFLRQTRGVGEQSESASPILARSPPKTAVSESPLVKSMKPSTVRGSVYPKWSHPALFSPLTKQRSSSYFDPSKQTNVINPAEDGKEKLGTPKTPVMTFRRVPVTPLSSRQRAYGGFVAGTPGTPSSAYSRVPLTPARRIPIRSSSKTDIKTEPTANPVQGSIKKKLRWADILSACSPDPQHAEQTAQPVPASGSMNDLDSSSTQTVFRQDLQPQEPATSHRLITAPVEKSSSLSTTCSATDHSVMGNSSLVPLQATEPSLHAQQNLPFSTGLRDFSESLHPVQEGDEGDSQLDEVVERHKQKAVACDSMKSTADWSSVNAQESRVVAKTCDRSTTSPSQTDILARLQVLEEQEHGIQNEIQLLQMAMKKKQEADGNDDGISHPGPYPSQFSHSSTDQTNKSVINQVSSSGDGAMSTLNIGLQAACFDFPQTSWFDHKSVSMPPEVLSASAIHTSKCLTSASQGYAASSKICSESSYNTGLNVRTICVKTADLKYPENVSRGTVVLNPGAGAACSDIWLTGSTATRLFESKGFLSSNEVTCCDRDDGNVLDFDEKDCENLHVLSAEDEVKSQQRLTPDTMSSPTSDSPADALKHNMEYEDIFTKNVGGAFKPLCPPVDDVKVCGAQFHLEQQEHDSQIKTVPSERNSTQVDTGLFHNHQGGPISQTKMHQKQSLDMDVEEIKEEAIQSHEESSLAAQDQDMECSLDTQPEILHSWPTRFNPVSMIVQPRVLPSSTHANQQATTSMQINPPIWTTLALKSAANNNTLQASVDMKHQQATATSEVQTSQDGVTLPLSKEAIKKTTDITARGDGSGSVSPGFRVYASPTKRSPLHSTLRSRHGRMTSSALKNADLFLEALVEDECALYAGRLHSFFRNPMVVCDRQETPDPVAKVLTEGDDMHFLPVAGDSAFIDHRSATPFENSAFFSYVPV